MVLLLAMAALLAQPPELLKKAKDGDAAAQYELGSFYENAKGDAHDEYAAMKWYEKAATQGKAEAQYRLGMLAEGEKAARWMLAAANQGMGEAQFRFSVMLAQGNGVRRDFIAAYAWAELASQRGVDRAKYVKEQLEQAMRPDQVQLAKDRAKDWKPAR